MHRIIAAFLIAPASLPLVAALAQLRRPWERDQWVIVAYMAVVTYTVTIVAGVPALLLYRRRGWDRLWQFALGGALIGLALVVAARPVSLAALFYASVYGGIGAVSAAVFWLIGVCNNKAFAEGPYARTVWAAAEEFGRTLVARCRGAATWLSSYEARQFVDRKLRGRHLGPLLSTRPNRGRIATAQANRRLSFALSFFAWAEIIAGAIGSAITLLLVSWLVYGFSFISNFGDSNIAGAIALYIAFVLSPSLLMLPVGVGLLKRKSSARKVNMIIFPVVGLLMYKLAPGLWQLWGSLALLSVLSIALLAQPFVKQQFERNSSPP